MTTTQPEPQQDTLAHHLEELFGRYFMQTPENPEQFWAEAADAVVADVDRNVKAAALRQAAQAYPTGESVTRNSVKVWLGNRAESHEKGWIR